MEVWKFLIQRAGDRGWRPIETGNLQLTEGKYRIVANSSLIDTQIHTRVTYQNLGEILPQRKSQARDRRTNAKGLVVIIPSTQLASGIWQFVCSGVGTDGSTWHRVLKLRVLPNKQPKAPVLPIAATTVPQPLRRDLNGDSPAPTEPLIPMMLDGESASWADGLDRLLEQLEQDSLKPTRRQQIEPDPVPNLLQLMALSIPPSRSIELDRSTFAGVIPGNRLTIKGTCNLQLFSPDLIQKVQMSKLLICLRHPQTAEIILSLEHSIPSDLEIFAFSGQIQLPIETTTSLLMGEVNLYDRYNIQMGTTGFTVTIDLDPIHESELSFLQLLDDRTSEDEDPHQTLDRLTRELQLEPTPTQPPVQISAPTKPAPIPSLTATSPYPSVPVAYRRESPTSAVAPPPQPPESVQTDIESQLPQPSPPATGDLELDFDRPQPDLWHRDRQWDTLEVVVD
jgi:hypothetical protein